MIAELHHPHKSELWLAGETDFTGVVFERLENFTTNSEFMIINPHSVLDSGDSQTIELMYTASDANASGAYRIYSNDPDQNEIICQLSAQNDWWN